ncbi:hypothetical protein [Ornithinimicrobium sp. INDO-MA30-4]|uniref:hypothetical protein n=1 Tax=Ornithinimicrobium sp. INDO-MA30-4 TaxID=2908651 RepID=UPI001F24822C|nr:hypothetical protein [Ornithinimicrobium sp. INDO-MA30-4]UJH71170.1 hypothetical protein L0A91_04865 [Ornithinimicrobium sp. INDO-MA30-4]
MTGGPVAEVPSGLNDDSSTRAQQRVRRDKAREASDGFCGAWVLHPALVPVARAAFSMTSLGGPESMQRDRPTTTALVDPQRLADTTSLVEAPTLSGLRGNLRVSLRYLTAWFEGQASMVIDGQVEDFGTVELARLQMWQWAHHQVRLAEGLTVSERLVDRLMNEEVSMLLRRQPAARERIELAAQLLREAVGPGEPPAFISSRAYAALMGEQVSPVAEQSAA